MPLESTEMPKGIRSSGDDEHPMLPMVTINPEYPMSSIPPGLPPAAVQTAATAATKPVQADAASGSPKVDSVAISAQGQQLLAGDKDGDGDSH